MDEKPAKRDAIPWDDYREMLKTTATHQIMLALGCSRQAINNARKRRNIKYAAKKGRPACRKEPD